MKRYLIAATAVAFLVTKTVLADYGAGDVWIISGGGSLGIDNQSLGSGNSTTTYAVNLGIGHSLGDSFELLGLASYIGQTTTGSSTVSSGEFDGQLNWVLTGAHSDAFYIGGRAGEQVFNNSSGSASTFVFGSVLGKRFFLAANISYEPDFSVIFADNSGSISNPDLHIVPLQFTLLF